MIMVKTRMRAIPKACMDCGYCSRGSEVIYERPACRAIGGYGIEGKPISHPSDQKQIKVSKSRPKWCPLVEV